MIPDLTGVGSAVLWERRGPAGVLLMTLLLLFLLVWIAPALLLAPFLIWYVLRSPMSAERTSQAPKSSASPEGASTAELHLAT